MSKKYFVISDPHSFYTEMKTALKQAGFSKKNNDHILIVCGDLFDRGSEALKLYKFIMSIPKSRRILIRGNHETLYFELLNKDFPDDYDFSNGTVATFCQLAGMTKVCKGISMVEYLSAGRMYSYDYITDKETIDPDCQLQWNKIKDKLYDSGVTEWLMSDEWKDYYELDKFIFVHSFIPTKLKQSVIDQFGARAYNFENPEHFESIPGWRKLSTKQWEKARWGCPFEQYKAGLFASEEDAGKVLVCGHWHTSDFYKKLKHINKYNFECAPIYFSKGLIGLDGGCMYNPYESNYIHPQNVMVIDENFNCFDGNLKPLVELPEENLK